MNTIQVKQECFKTLKDFQANPSKYRKGFAVHKNNPEEHDATTSVVKAATFNLKSIKHNLDSIINDTSYIETKIKPLT